MTSPHPPLETLEPPTLTPLFSRADPRPCLLPSPESGPAGASGWPSLPFLALPPRYLSAQVWARGSDSSYSCTSPASFSLTYRLLLGLFPFNLTNLEMSDYIFHFTLRAEGEARDQTSPFMPMKIKPILWTDSELHYWEQPGYLIVAPA